MKSNITLYYKSLVNKDKNFVLDDGSGTNKIDTYLSSLQSTTITNFQYIKHQLSITIKINSSQANLEMVDSKDLNYVKIINFNVVNNEASYERSIYYFVINKIWRGKDTIELVLAMDTLNSFKFNSDYKINAKTLVKRMHKDRFKSIGLVEKILTDAEDVLSYASLEDGYADIHEDDWYDIDVELEPHQIELWELYGGVAKLFQIYDDTLGRFLNPWEYWDVEINLMLEDVYIYATWSIKTNPDWNTHTFYLSFHIIGYEINIIRIIDLKSEDISCPVYKREENILYEQKGKFINSWVLYYKNQTDEDSPVECYLTSDVPLTFLTETGSNTITSSDITDGKLLLITPQMNDNESISIDVDGTIYRSYIQENMVGSEDGCWVIGIQNSGGTLTFRYYRYLHQSMSNKWTKLDEIEIINPSTISVDSALSELRGRLITPPAKTTYEYADSDNPFRIEHVNKVLTLTPLTERTLASSSTIDKTLSENLKIINIPYCPSTINEDSGKYVIDALWKYDAVLKFFKLDDLSVRFNNFVITNVDDILKHFLMEDFDYRTTLYRHYKDSKLFHSDYFRPKFVYDSFNTTFQLEEIDYEASKSNKSSDKFEFNFVMSRNIVSKFLFKFNYVYNNSTQDYENIVAVSRNNEEVLYNSQYLNYIRTGYNYDLKAKERQEVTSGVTIGLSALGLVASGVAGAITGNPIAIGSAIASGISLATSLVNYAKTTAQSEENIQRKLQETQRQAVSVLNADDYDLLYEYTSNKAKLCLYEMSENMKQILDDLFYYTGYIINQQMIPNISSRYWFNFVQASLILDDSSNMSSEIEDDIKEKFELGVTFLHYHNKFDFNQEMENLEWSLLG